MNFFENLTVDNQAVKDLKELIPLSIMQDEDFNKYIHLVPAKDGERLGFIGDMNDVGIAGSGCDPVYQEVGVGNSEKIWSLGDWQIPIKICYESLKGTIAEYSLKTGTDIADLTSTEFMSYILRPALETAMKRMIWRFGWFGDKAASDITGGGVIKDGVNVNLFKTCDGLFKRLLTQIAANPDQRTTIAANAQATFALQKSTMLVKGTATGIMDTMLMDADSRITEDAGSIVLMTKLFADALHHDIKERFNLQLKWETVFSGFDVAEYDGVRIARISIWDRFIRAYENDGTKLNNPYRAVFANPDQLLVGAPAGGLMSDLDIWFEKKERRNYIYSTGKMGTLIKENDMFHFGV